jgi:hypothetical protein
VSPPFFKKKGMAMEYEECIGEWGEPIVGGGLPVTYEEYFENLRANCKRDLPNLKQQPETDKIMVMVCGGPTAKDFLEEIRAKGNDDNYVIVCSNKTHDWLIENQIVPDIFFMIDPKKGKVKDVQHPHKDVRYLIGAQCTPGVFDALEGYNVTRILTYCNIKESEYNEYNIRTGTGLYDSQIIDAFIGATNYTQLDGGTMAGLRAMTLGNILGFKTVEFYGFDSCFFDTDKDGNPIYYSYDKKRIENIRECECSDGRVFLTTPVFESQARQFIKWKHKLEWMKFIIHGDSLTAHIDKIDEEQLKPKHDLLITPYMRKLVAEHHRNNPSFGGYYAIEHVGSICLLAGQLIKKFGGEMTVLDYGCGKGKLKELMPPITGLTVINYDPCMDEFSQRPEPADIVVCTDVLEHIEMECLENVLDDLKRLCKKACYVTIAMGEANNYYSDGQNAHLIVKPPEWWIPKLQKRFNINESKTIKDAGHNHMVCVMQAKEIR